MQVSIGLPDPKEFSSMPRLKLVQSGIQHHTCDQQTRAVKIRLPITPAILHKIRDYWLPKSTEPDIKMLWAAVVICFFGFFRSGEITVPSLNSFDPSTHLGWGDVSLDNVLDPTMLKVHLRKSKTDQLKKGVDVYIGKINGSLCPVGAGVEYMSTRGSDLGPFFKFSNGQPLTKSRFTQHVRDALQALGLPHNEFAGHSFRIGAATAAAQVGIEDSVIRTMGRWNSSAFLVYIQTPPTKLAQFTRRLAAP